MPPDFGCWNNVYRRYRRWGQKGVWAKVFEILIDKPDLEWLIIDATFCKVHPHASGAVGGNQAMDRSKGGLTTKIHLAGDAHEMPLRALITEGTKADCTMAIPLIEGLDEKAENLLGDKAYDTNAIAEYAMSRGMEAVIPPKKNRKENRVYDKVIYKARHLVEMAHLRLKEWHGIATRYAKKADSFLTAIQIRCIFLWANIL